MKTKDSPSEAKAHAATDAEINALVDAIAAGEIRGKAGDFHATISARLARGDRVARSPRQVVRWFADLRSVTADAGVVSWSRLPTVVIGGGWLAERRQPNLGMGSKR